MPQDLLFFLMYFVVGSLAGTVAGLLGIGGGILVVPLLALIFQHHPGISHNNIMHVAAGTSLAVMVVTGTRSLLAHRKHHIVFWPYYRKLAPGVIVGVVGGVILAHSLHSDMLRIILGVFAVLLSIKTFFHRDIRTHREFPGCVGASSVGVVVGAKSGLLGLGGGALTIPFLLYCNVDMRTAIVTSIATTLTVAIIGSISVAISGMHVIGLPAWSTGYIHWPAWFAVALGTVTFAPLGAKLSYKVPTQILKRFFAAFLMVMGLHMLL